MPGCEEVKTTMGSFILGLLLVYGPQTLYSLNQRFQQGPSLFYSASFGALQGALRGLAAAGHVSIQEVTEGGRLKKVHTITEDGVAAFHAWIRSPIEGDIEIGALTRLFHLGLVPEADRREILAGIVGAVEAQVADLDALYEGVMAQASEVPDELAEVFHYQLATLDYGRAAHRAALAWFAAREDAPGVG